MSAQAGKPAPRLSRRRFVALTGAGLAALSAGGPALGASEAAKSGGATKSKKPAAPDPTPATPPPSAQQKEYERQKTGTLSALKTLRAYALPPGGNLPVVFKPMREPKKEH